MGFETTEVQPFTLIFMNTNFTSNRREKIIFGIYRTAIGWRSITCLSGKKCKSLSLLHIFSDIFGLNLTIREWQTEINNKKVNLNLKLHDLQNPCDLS